MSKLLIFLFALLLLSPSSAFAATDCAIIYGGGEITCDKPTTTPKPRPEADQPVAETKPNQTKGGLPVHPPTNATTTPATGPETLGLIALVPAAGLGFWLRRKIN